MLYLNFVSCFIGSASGNLTLTNVVFELKTIKKLVPPIKDLTLTNVVFEFTL